MKKYANVPRGGNINPRNQADFFAKEFLSNDNQKYHMAAQSVAIESHPMITGGAKSTEARGAPSKSLRPSACRNIAMITLVQINANVEIAQNMYTRRAVRDTIHDRVIGR